MNLLIAAIALALGAPPSDESSLSRSLATIVAAERGKVSLEAAAMHAETIVEKLNAQHAGTVNVDWSAVSSLRVDRDDPIDLVLHDVTFLDAVRALAHALGEETDRPVVDATPGQLLITTRYATIALQETAIYDVADMASDPTLLPLEASTAPVGAAPVAIDEDLGQRMNRLIDLITEHIDPDGWETNGGTRGKISTEAARLIVSATPMAHHDIRALLTNLRRESPLAAQIGITLVDVPTSALDELSKQSDGDVSAMARLVSKRDDARRGWSPRVVARLEEEASIESSDSGGIAKCRLTARHDRIAGVLSVALDFDVKRGTSAATFKSVLPFAHGEGEVAIALATGPASDRTWILCIRAEEIHRE